MTREGAAMIDDNDDADDRTKVFRYLLELESVFRIIIRQEEKDDVDMGGGVATTTTTTTTSSSRTCEEALSSVSSLLLQAFRPEILEPSSNTILPKQLIFPVEWREDPKSYEDLPEPQDYFGALREHYENETTVDPPPYSQYSLLSENIRQPPRKRRRLDYLRQILRGLGSISWDVAGHICEELVRSARGLEQNRETNPSDAISSNTLRIAIATADRVAAFLLFATWVPVAPHLLPLISELFQLDCFGSPLQACLDPTAKRSTDDPTEARAQWIQTFLLVEATNTLYNFISARAEWHVIPSWWSYEQLFPLMNSIRDFEEAKATKDDRDGDVTMMDSSTSEAAMDLQSSEKNDVDACFKIEWVGTKPFDVRVATQWHAVRAIAHGNAMPGFHLLRVTEQLGVQEDRPPWVLHPFIIHEEEYQAQSNLLRGRVCLLHDESMLKFPTAEQVRRVLSLCSMLSHVQDGLVFCRHDPFRSILEHVMQTIPGGPKVPRRTWSTSRKNREKTQRWVATDTAQRNLSLVSGALAHNAAKPILVCGPAGSGKSSLVRQLLTYVTPPRRRQDDDEDNQHFADENLLELHVDEETDSKTLIGSYTTTDVPGEFEWRPGALTQAVRVGKWVLLEDVDTVPMEIQAALVKLLEDRMLPLGGGKFEPCHANFRLFGTCTTTTNEHDQSSPTLRQSVYGSNGGKRVLHPQYWLMVHVDPFPPNELRQVAMELFPSLPLTIVVSALRTWELLCGGVAVSLSSEDLENEEDAKALTAMATKLRSTLSIARHPSVRDLLKLLSRITVTLSTATLDPNAQYITESQRTLCLAETFDCFASAFPTEDDRRNFLRFAAPIWSISVDLAVRYVETRTPAIVQGSQLLEVGRGRIRRQETRQDHIDSTGDDGQSTVALSKTFAPTSNALRLMESIAVGISNKEPILLCGETGCGKTSLIQQLAAMSGRGLVVQNLSLQTDSTDLLGGYRPLEIKQLARTVYLHFVDLFVSTFSRKQNADFLSFAAKVHKKEQWKKLSQCFQRAAKLGLGKVKERGSSHDSLQAWREFEEKAETFEKQRQASGSGLAFSFTEGILVDAIRTGKWVLLDEINLASSETLQRLSGLLDDSSSSLVLSEKGDAEAIARHADFRLFAAMNPATDAGKKNLPPSIRSRFTEYYVSELLDPIELRSVAAKYLVDALVVRDKALQHTDTVVSVVSVYLKCRNLASSTLTDGSGQRPRYTLRTLCRALTASRNLVLQQKLSLNRALLEGFELVFEGSVDQRSSKLLKKLLRSELGQSVVSEERDHPGRRPNKRDSFVLIKPFWLKAGPLEPEDWSESSRVGRPKFVLTKSMTSNLRRLVRAVASGPWPILLEGPTSAGKTTLVEYLAARCGHHVVRINNHEHTDVQEYTGAYAADSNGALSFRDGLLVKALRKGDWVILDELNLAPSEVLEALNRLLDDNRELFLAEVNEVVKPHPHFRLFATQNPSGAYGGRKQLSRAFRNRFVEIQMPDIPTDEMALILERRCSCPPSHSKALVKIMTSLQQRRSKGGVFLGKDGLITPRDLLRWAERKSSSKTDLALEGFMLLGERLRNNEEKEIVKTQIENHLKVKIDYNDAYYGPDSESRRAFDEVSTSNEGRKQLSMAPTKSMLRLLKLVLRCARNKEPVLLVGDTGCGKTSVIQFMSKVMNRELQIINCHATTETSDLIGGLRPVRGRNGLPAEILSNFCTLVSRTMSDDVDVPSPLPTMVEVGDGKVHIKSDSSLSEADTRKVILATRKIRDSLGTKREGVLKKRKLAAGDWENSSGDSFDKSIALASHVERLCRKYLSLFEWEDGPLVEAMRRGSMILLDEMSLAEDAVLERLNSVLEPTRTIVLAEKGDESDDSGSSHVVKASEGFLLFATMNPGGDFGKRELSPALRSRFTEVWVPAISDMDDFAVVIDAILSEFASSSMRSSLKNGIIDYLTWFNATVCGSSSSPFTGMTLSVRDIVTWARFIFEVTDGGTNDSVMVWKSFCHGACLMHLDGLGLGSGISPHDLSQIREKAHDCLLNQVPDNLRDACIVAFRQVHSHKVVMENIRFGIDPFFIGRGVEASPKDLFQFEAPTTASNLMRVLRAMQLPKPILLEGSPGVGKTSLISALARASGFRLVRINLSEQTDISDLFGSDLPVPKQGNEEDTGATFQWCDGVLLQAIKNGDWVLLDELNLASQTVLEGLNSCLDHRASVFIPELGTEFKCPSSFRVFGAQNPLGQGGGRKGLPKSFLNRFTKVFVDALNQNDMNMILSRRFPTMSATTIKMMIEFNSNLEELVVDQRVFGHLGSPWEFNLRDLFRWCDLACFQTDERNELGPAARDLFIVRFRTKSDRSMFRKLFAERFEDFGLTSFATEMMIGRLEVFVGSTRVRRSHSLFNLFESSSRQLGEHLKTGLLPSVEAFAKCMNMRLPCLLVGKAGTGKSTVVSTIANVCNMKVLTLSLTPSTDVAELIGGYEQRGSQEDFRVFLRIADLLYSLACVCVEQTDLCCRASLGRIHGLLASMRKIDLQSDGFVQLATEIADLFGFLKGDFLTAEKDKIEAMNLTLSNIKRSGSRSPLKGGFEWKDGLLVEAMRNGHWLHLENVNFCSASVLDRLNPVLEEGGSLLLNECGWETDESNRNIQPHPDFRVILSMCPEHGEVSRAMRNRCVEICLDDVQEETGRILSVQYVDFLAQGSVVSCSLAKSIQATHSMLAEEAAIVSADRVAAEAEETGEMIVGLLNRGLSLKQSIRAPLRVGWELQECSAKDAVADFVAVCRQEDCDGPLPFSMPTGSWRLRRSDGSLLFQARCVQLLRAMRLLGNRGHRTLSNLLSQHFEIVDDSFADLKPIDPITIVASEENTIELVSYFLNTSVKEDDSVTRSNLFVGWDTWLSSIVKFMESRIQDNLRTKMSPQSPFNSLLAPTLVQSTVKAALLERVRGNQEESQQFGDMSVLEFAYHLQQQSELISIVECNVSPILAILFDALDAFIECLISQGVQDEECAFFDTLWDLIDRRENFWKLLTDTTIDMNDTARWFGLNESAFIVQWVWLKKKYHKVEALLSMNSVVQSKVDAFRRAAERLDRVLTGTPSFALTKSDMLWKKGGHPVVPALITASNMTLRLRAAADSFSILSDDRFDYCLPKPTFSSLTLDELVESTHPTLFLTKRSKQEFLEAMCTTQWASTDEIAGKSRRILLTNVDKFQQLLDELDRRQSAFKATIEALRVDRNIDTVENQLGVEALNKLQSDLASDEANEAQNTLDALLKRFAALQIDGIREAWCMKEEFGVISDIAKSVVQGRVLDSKGELRKRIGRMLDEGLLCLAFPLVSLRPLQSLLWILDVPRLDEAQLLQAIRSLLPLLLANAMKHQWKNNCMNLALVLTSPLELPMLWNDDQSKEPKEVSSSICDPRKLQASPVTETLINLLRDEFLSSFFPGKRSLYATLENHSARRYQAEELLKQLSSFEFGLPRLLVEKNLLCYQISHVVSAFQSTFQPDRFAELHHIATDFSSLKETTNDHIKNLIQSSSSLDFKSVCEPIILPLFSLLRSMAGEDPGQIAFAFVYTGLLQVHLLLPSSPIDPGRKPAAKAEQHLKWLDSSRKKIGIERLHYALRTGSVSITSDCANRRFGTAKLVSSKRKAQQAKRVDRSNTAKPFRHLYQAIISFARSTGSRKTVMNLVNVLQSATMDQPGIAATMEQNWQVTAGAFCRRLENEFREYDDVIVPLVIAIRSMQHGLRQMRFHSSSKDDTCSPIAALIEFPFGDVTKLSETKPTHGLLASPLVSRKTESKEHSELALLVAMLCRIETQKRSLGRLDGAASETASWIFLQICRNWSQRVDSVEDIDETDDEAFERQLKEQFPDHRNEFRDTGEEQEAGDVTVENVERDNDHPSKGGVYRVDQLHIETVCKLHQDIFSVGEMNSSPDCSRIRAAHASYLAACTNLETNNFRPADDRTLLGGHLLALCRGAGLSVNQRCTTLPGADHSFYHDANPDESAKATDPLMRLMQRTSKLLTAFPGHSVLLTLGQVAENVCKLSLASTPLAKVMRGLETILRKAQEWEQHASDRVRLGTPLSDVTSLVAQWRKKELACWYSLLLSREHRIIEKAHRHWVRMYSILGALEAERRSIGDPNSWIWKGTGLKRAGVADEHEFDCFELFKTLDSFILTSPLGEFATRLKMIESIANEFVKSHSPRSHLGKIMDSLAFFYKQYSSYVSCKIDSLRAPIERKLRDEVKLAKWDEQSYYALVDTTERNHRKLMKLLREYDDVLMTPVSEILEQLLAQGIRQSDDGVAVTKVPPNTEIFPVGSEATDGEPQSSIGYDKEALDNKWTPMPHLRTDTPEILQKLDVFVRKLIGFHSDLTEDRRISWCRHGSYQVSSMTQAIFERIDSLRSPKATRPMKERAFVELLKTLQRQGIKSTKWSVPMQLKSTYHVFRLPRPDTSNPVLCTVDRKVLEDAESYYQKCLAESIRFRAEVSMFGSKYLGQREIQMMLNHSEHCLFLVSQQRCSLTEILEDLRPLQRIVAYSEKLPLTHLPSPQRSLSAFVSNFQDASLSVIENVGQLRLLLKTTLPFVRDRNKVQDILSQSEHWTPDSILKWKQAVRDASIFISSDDLLQVSETVKDAIKVRDDLIAASDALAKRSCLPSSVFESTIKEVGRLITVGNQCLGSVDEDSSTDKCDVILESLSKSVEKTLVVIQTLIKANPQQDDLDSTTIYKCHIEAIVQQNDFDLGGLDAKLEELMLKISEASCNHKTVEVLKNAIHFMDHALRFLRAWLHDKIDFFRSSTKLQYVLIRVFRVLVAKGYCADKTEEEDGEGNGDASGMTFEDDVDGTGMGEGDGKKDVTDELESEEQISGLKSDQNETAEKDSRQLDEKEAEQGMEMEQDFDGEMFDVPEDEREEDDVSQDDQQEELDREMGDGVDPNEDVVDEKLWGESDDEDDIDKDNEKFEKDSKLQAESVEDEMRTKEDDERTKEENNASPDERQEAQLQGDKEDEGSVSSALNEDFEENYEESNCVDIRNENADEGEEDGEEEMNLDETMDLDDGGETEDHEENDETPLNEDEKSGESELDDEKAQGDNIDDDQEDESANAESCGAQGAGAEAEANPPTDGDDDEDFELENTTTKNNPIEEAGESYGVQAIDGSDKVLDNADEKKAEERVDSGAEKMDEDGGDGEDEDNEGLDGGRTGDGGGGGGGDMEEEMAEGDDGATDEAPNPFRNPGELSKFWHRKLHMVERMEGERDGNQNEDLEKDEDSPNTDTPFEFTDEKQSSTTQVLAETREEEEAVPLEAQDTEDSAGNPEEKRHESNDTTKSKSEENSSQKKAMSRSNRDKKQSDDDDASHRSENEQEGSAEEAEDMQVDTMDLSTSNDENIDEEAISDADNRVVTDLDQLELREDESDAGEKKLVEHDEFPLQAISLDDLTEARSKWSNVCHNTFHLSRRLCEALRLVMEPLLATKLQGDYRTGKRIHMKRVIGYIASGYRKDKIWLRRTKPAKRNYRVLLAVDNSESMQSGGAGMQALAGLATLVNGMSQLEIGQVGVCSFGEEMRMLHPLDGTPFTKENGAMCAHQLAFNEPRTRTALCVEAVLDVMSNSSASMNSEVASLQLVFLLSDGRIERDSRSSLRRLMREMKEQNILLVLLIVEGNRDQDEPRGKSSKTSLINMKEVTFDSKGRPKVKHFMEDYPIPYYIIVEDIQSLPEVLSDSLRQWFEIIAQQQRFRA